MQKERTTRVNGYVCKCFYTKVQWNNAEQKYHQGGIMWHALRLFIVIFVPPKNYYNLIGSL